jgi:uncharacterized membrane protein YbhN (UPF0104 family)
MMRHWAGKWLAGLLVSLATLAYVASVVSLDRVPAILASSSYANILAAFCLTLSIAVLRAWRWQIIIHWFGVAVPFWRSFELVQLGNFVTQWVPGVIGGDIVRAWAAPKLSCPLKDASYAIAMDRLLGFVGLTLVGAGSGFFFLENFRDQLGFGFAAGDWMLWTMAGPFLLGMAVFFAFARFSWVRQGWDRALRIVKLQKWKMALLLGLSMSCHLIFCLMVFLLLHGLGLKDIAFLDVLLTLPPVMLLAMLPISVAGWGIREGAMIFAMSYIGVPRSEAFAVSILVGILSLTAAMHGAFVMSRIAGAKRS